MKPIFSFCVALIWMMPYKFLLGIADDSILVDAQPAIATFSDRYLDSPALQSEGHRKQFLSIRHHLCTHRFFLNEARARSSTHVFPYVWQGIQMELGVLAATTRTVKYLDDSDPDSAIVMSFEALLFSSKRNHIESVLNCYSHCTSELPQFTDLVCIVNGVTSPAFVYQPNGWKNLQSVLKCNISANASTNFALAVSSRVDSLHAILDLCALNRSKVHKVVGCTQPWMDAHSLEHRYPGIHKAYVLCVLSSSSRSSLQVVLLNAILYRFVLQVSPEVCKLRSHLSV